MLDHICAMEKNKAEKGNRENVCSQFTQGELGEWYGVGDI